MDNKVVKIIHRDIPVESSHNPIQGIYNLIHKYSIEVTESFDESIFEAIKEYMVEKGIHRSAVIDKEALVEMIATYQDPDYIKITRCEKCTHWRPMKDNLGVCCKAGVMREKDYYCRDGASE